MSPSGSLGDRHVDFGRRGSDIVVMMGTVAMCCLVWRANVMCVRFTLHG